MRAWYELPELGKGYLPWLDVEHPDEHHKSVRANLDTARELAERMARLELLDGLVVGLSGSGVRFALPWACEPALAAGFEGFLRDKGRFPGIDASPQLKGQHFRWTAYRGNRRQVQVPAKGAPPTTRDIHVHFLDRAEELLRLTEARYRELTAGRPDPARMLEDVRRCLPTTWTPEPWRELLTEYDRDARLRRHIVRVRLPKLRDEERRSRTPEPEVILAELASRGIRARAMVVKGTPAWRLSSCPVCGKGEGNPTLYASGWLHDFRATCPAGGERDLGKGLPWRAWSRLAGLEHLAPDQPDQPDDQVEPERQAPPPGETMTVAQARVAIREALESEDPAVLVKASAGIGKSHAALEYALKEAEKGVLVLFSAPTNDLSAELEAKAADMALKMGLEPTIFRYEGRGKLNCTQSTRCEELAKKGFSPALLACGACWNRDGCAYRAQIPVLKAMRSGIIFCAHGAVPHIARRIGRRVGVWIADENPRQAMLKTVTVEQGAMTSLQCRLVGQAEAVLEKTAQAARRSLASLNGEDSRVHARLYAASETDTAFTDDRPLWSQTTVTDAERETLGRDLALWEQLDGESPTAWQKRLYAEKIDPFALLWWRIALKEHAGTAYVKAKRHKTKPIKYRALLNMTPRLDCKVRILDATGLGSEVEALLGRPVKTVTARAELPAGCRTVWVRQGLGKLKAEHLEDAALAKYLRQACQYLRPTDRAVLLMTHLCIEDRLLAMARKTDPSRTWFSIHHGDTRGTNAYEECDAAVCVGVQTPNRDLLIDTEVALYGDDQAAKDAWFRHLVLAELVQGMARVRPVLAPKTLVVLGHVWPHEDLGAPSFTVDQRRKGGAAEAEDAAFERLLPLARKYQLMFSELAALVGVFRQEDKAGLDDWQARVQPVLADESTLANAGTVLRDIFNTVPAMAEGVSPIRLPDRGHGWSRLIARLADATGLPDLTYKPRTAHGGGRGQAALGFLVAVRRFCASLGVEYDPSLWDGQARPSGPPDWLSFPPGSHFVVDGVAVDAGTVYRIEDPSLPRQAVAAFAPG